MIAWGGRTRLQHVLMNLIGDALDAVPNDRRHQIAIEQSTQPDGTIAISVMDNGTGNAEDALAKVFDPFFTTKDVGKGLGLGLSICFNTVRDFGGTIRAENLARWRGPDDRRFARCARPCAGRGICRRRFSQRYASPRRTLRTWALWHDFSRRDQPGHFAASGKASSCPCGSRHKPLELQRAGRTQCPLCGLQSFAPGAQSRRRQLQG